MEKFFDVKLVFVQFQCPQCLTGFLVQIGQQIQGMNMVLSIPHQCNNTLCGFGQSFPGVYPHMRQIVGKQINDPLAEPV